MSFLPTSCCLYFRAPNCYTSIGFSLIRIDKVSHFTILHAEGFCHFQSSKAFFVKVIVDRQVIADCDLVSNTGTADTLFTFSIKSAIKVPGISRKIKDPLFVNA